jgi:integrase
MQRVVALIEYLRPTPIATPTFVRALTGLRGGERLALRWHNINLETGLLSVRRVA